MRIIAIPRNSSHITQVIGPRARIREGFSPKTAALSTFDATGSLINIRLC
jgi:hypothetical protein